jgi:hypothetical protein
MISMDKNASECLVFIRNSLRQSLRRLFAGSGGYLDCIKAVQHLAVRLPRGKGARIRQLQRHDGPEQQETEPIQK